MTASAPRCLPLGDSALLLVLGDTIGRELHDRVSQAANELRANPVHGVIEVVPAYATLGVWFDPFERSFDDLGKEIQARLASLPQVPAAAAGREWIIPVHYDGPDLAEVADRTGLRPTEVIARHAAPSYHVYLLGFVPGFAYLGDLDPSLVLPRRASPRQRVPSGSVAIAGAQTAIYPLETPGGWHLIGRTGMTLFDPARNPATLLRVGDTVRFEPVP